MRESRREPLIEDQVEVFESCRGLLGGGGEVGWKVLKSTKYPEVQMSMQYFPPKKGEMSIGTGGAVGVVDSSAEEVAAWGADFCSNDRMRIHREEGHLSRLELREKAKDNERTFATVEKLQFPVANREFVFRQFWKSEEGKKIIAVESVGDDVDYGVKLK